MISEAMSRTLARRHKPCTVRGCTATVHGLSVYCARHHTLFQRHGSPTQTAIQRGELAPYLARVKKFTADNESHPALCLAWSEIQAWIAAGAERASAMRGVQSGATSKKRLSWQERMALESHRLHQAGVTGREIFETICALYILSVSDPRRLEPFSEAFKFAVSRHVFNRRHRAGSRKFTMKGDRTRKYIRELSPVLLRNAGNQFVLYLLPLLQKVEKCFKDIDTRDERRRAQLIDAMKQQSFALNSEDKR
jgi:hypothetical protein